MDSGQVLWSGSGHGYFPRTFEAVIETQTPEVFIAAICSGSNGNCYYVGTQNDGVLIDAGASFSEIARRMAVLHLCPTKLRGIFVSHEHTDHVRGLELLAHRWDLPIWGTKKTLLRCRLGRSVHRGVAIEADSWIAVGELNVLPFRKKHDAADPVSFVVEHGGVRIGVFTDIGRCCEALIRHFKTCHAVFLEANYCEEMLASGSYPYHLKHRISGGYGHISNNEALALFREHRSPHLSHLLLSHLSGNNNSPERALQTFLPYCEDTEVVVASRFQCSPVFRISPPAGGAALPVMAEQAQAVAQISLF